MSSASASTASGGLDIPFNPYDMPPLQPNQELRPRPYAPSGGSDPVLAPGPSAPAPGALPGPAAPTPQFQDISEGVNGGSKRPPNVRKESSVTFSNVGADGNDYNSSRVLLESPSATEGRKAQMSRRSRLQTRLGLKGRPGTSVGDSRPMYSIPSAVTSVADVQTAYVNMLMALDRIHWVNEAFAIASCWLLLAGFVVMPQALTETIPDFLRDQLNSKSNQASGDELKSALTQLITHANLFYIAGGVSGAGLLGMVSLWWQWRGNYIWITQKIFISGFSNGLIGSISTLISVYLLKEGEWDPLSKAAIGVVGGVTVASGVLILIYWYLTERLIKKHRAVVGKHGTGKAGRGYYKGFEG